ncbi:unnamed protein product [Gulo gulo]|uniref:Uncharacterized protein n=1 Tax=Gulo gulo TaxID=48420 RepID=A0A9X9PYL9_GULGU|nr:unnamed protein product [Gulo gulo]
MTTMRESGTVATARKPGASRREVGSPYKPSMTSPGSCPPSLFFLKTSAARRRAIISRLAGMHLCGFWPRPAPAGTAPTLPHLLFLRLE